MKRLWPCLVALIALLGPQLAAAQSYCDRLQADLNAPGGDSETQGYVQALNSARSELGQANAQAAEQATAQATAQAPAVAVRAP